ncbi:hypothetical protein [Candidatus Similichlamydia laticola]|uniref:Uncharacterized protein n=1 Tax=Candidatus Similichlamydia laticola TaxID=2170265 RepID=A0A369KHF8_9BACT|nr:hypothetical protein [Candidatus Similichlamydia laticola]RDB31233.1 hypothetical protein HAT2_00713 [Candidatus Similichlamydia laticola]
MSLFFCNLFQVLAAQANSSAWIGRIPLAHSAKEIVLLKGAFAVVHSHLEQELPLFLPISIADLLVCCDTLSRVYACLRGSLEAVPYVQEFFFVHCCLGEVEEESLLSVPSYLRHLLNDGPVEASRGLPAFSFSRDPFWIEEADFLRRICCGLSSLEERFFCEIFASNCAPYATTHRSQFIDSIVCIFCLSVRQLFLEEGGPFFQDIPRCALLCENFVEVLRSVLAIFSEPCLISCFLSESFNISGLMIGCFSYRDDDRRWEDLVLQHTCWEGDQSITRSFASVESGFRFQEGQYLSEIALCQAFLLAYGPEGRLMNFKWPVRPTSVLVDLRALFRRLFSIWLNFCHSIVLPYTLAHQGVFFSPLSLRENAAFALLKAGENDHSTLEVILNQSRKALSNQTGSFVFLQSLFPRFCSSEFCRRQVLNHLSHLEATFWEEEVILLDRPLSAETLKTWISARMCHLKDFSVGSRSDLTQVIRCGRSHLIKVLKLLPFCEKSLASFYRMEWMVKLFLKVLHHSRFDLSILLIGLNLILEASALRHSRLVSSEFRTKVSLLFCLPLRLILEAQKEYQVAMQRSRRHRLT